MRFRPLLLMKILIIDDSLFLRDKLHKAIHEIDQSIEIREEQTFSNGESTSCSFAPDLVIFEIDLESEGGMTLLRKMNAVSRDTRVIIFTDHSTDEFKTKYLQAGADYFFDKCKEYREMLDVIRNLVIHKK
jgi:DNA-binding response OmpR family regulator